LPVNCGDLSELGFVFFHKASSRTCVYVILFPQS
jgi:hypothetical protein